MSTYAIGDIQGCFTAFQQLLAHIHFDPARDSLWLTGDLVNRGPHSLETLRFVKNLGESVRIVLGNHDLHLLAVAHLAHPGWAEDTLQPILAAEDRDELIHWLLQHPLLHHDPTLGYIMIHAGLAPTWTLTQAKALAEEVSVALKSSAVSDFFLHLYGNEPAKWDAQLTGWDRLRCITNYFTRARYCHADGRLALDHNQTDEKDLVPWFKLPQRKTRDLNIIFGHWAALSGVTNTAHTYALDTGCVWGYRLTAMQLETKEIFWVRCG